MSDFVIIENLKELIRKAMIYAEKAHDLIFEENTDNSIAIAYLNISASKFASAEALYYSNLDILERDEAEQIFHTFEIFAEELLENCQTVHSHQWTDIEFQRLKDCFDYSVFAFENVK